MIVCDDLGVCDTTYFTITVVEDLLELRHQLQQLIRIQLPVMWPLILMNYSMIRLMER